MSVYNYKNHYAFQPVGSIIEYLGASDPDGWIICDGKERTNNSDGRYNSLYNLGIGSGGNGTNNYIPPNLANYFLLGASTNTSVGITGGTGYVQLTSDNLPAHNHSMQHGHYCGGRFNETPPSGYGSTNAQLNSSTATKQANNYFYQQNGISTSTSYDINTGLIKENTGNSGIERAFSNIPLNYTVNYILKY